MANTHIRRCSASLVVREMQIKMKYYFTPTRMAIIFFLKNKLEYKMMQDTVENSLAAPQKQSYHMTQELQVQEN